MIYPEINSGALEYWMRMLFKVNEFHLNYIKMVAEGGKWQDYHYNHYSLAVESSPAATRPEGIPFS